MAKKKMSGKTKAFSEALDYLQNGGLVTEATDNPAKFKEALDLIRKENPNHPILDRVKGILQELGLWDQFEEEKKPEQAEENAESVNAEPTKESAESVNTEAAETSADDQEPIDLALEGTDFTAEFAETGAGASEPLDLGLENADVAAENADVAAENADVVEENAVEEQAKTILSDYTYEKYISERRNNFVADFISRIDITIGEGEQKRILPENNKKEHLELLFEAVKLDTLTHMNADPNMQAEYEAHSTEEKRAEYVDGLIADNFAGELVTIVAAGQMQMSQQEEQLLSEKGYAQFLQAQRERAARVIEGISDTSDRFKVKSEHIWSLTATISEMAERVVGTFKKNTRVLAQKAEETEDKTEKRAYEVLAAKYQKTAVDLASMKQKVDAKANKVSKGAYKIYKSVLANLSDNAVKIGANTVKTVALTALLATPVAREAVICYAGLYAAGAWVHPIITEARRIKRVNKAEGKEKLTFKERFKMARRRIVPSNAEIAQASEDKKREMLNARRKYFVRAGVETGAAVLLGGLAGKLTGVLAEAENLKGAVKGAKSTVVVTKLGASNTAQMVETGASAVQSAKYKDAASKAALKNDAIGLGIGLLSSGLTMFMMGDGGSEKLNEFCGKVKSWFARDNKAERLMNVAGFAREPEEMSYAADTVAVQSGDANSAEAVASTVAETEYEPVGLFPREYSEDMGISEKQYNTLVKTMEGTLTDANGNNVTLDRAYMNLTDDVMNRYFDGMTREEVLYKYNRLYAMTRFAVAKGEGTYRELVTSGPQFASHNTEMTALTNLLGCGNQTEELSGVNTLLADDKFNEIMHSGSKNTIFTGHSLADGCEENKGEWKVVAQKVAEQHIEQPELPEITIDEIKDEPIVIEDVKIDLDAQPLRVQQIRIPEPEPSYTAIDIATNNSSEEFTGEVESGYVKDVTETLRGQKAINRVKNMNGGR